MSRSVWRLNTFSARVLDLVPFLVILLTDTASVSVKGLRRSSVVVHQAEGWEKDILGAHS